MTTHAADFDRHFRASALAPYEIARRQAGTSPVHLVRVDSPAHQVVDPPTGDLVIALILASDGAAHWSWDGGRTLHASARRPGQVGVTPFNASGAFDIEGPSSVLLLTVPQSTIRDRLGDAAFPRDLGALHDAYCDRPVLKTLCRRLWRMAGSHTFGRDLRVDALCESLLTALCRNGGPVAPDGNANALSAGEQRRIMGLLHEGTPDVAALAAQLAMPERTFRRRFKATYGIPPHQWLIQQKLEQAKRLLRDTCQPLTDIALALGFAHQAHFSAAFAEATGCPPGRYRRGASDAPLRP